MSSANDAYSQSDADTEDIPQGADSVDNSYASRSGQSDSVPVLKDDAPVEQSNDGTNPDSDEMLERDDADAIDKSNIMDGSRTRGAKPSGTYTEPSDEEGLPGAEDGTSSTR